MAAPGRVSSGPVQSRRDARRCLPGWFHGPTVTPGSEVKNKMIEQLPQSSGCVLGFQFIGEVTDADYTEVFIPALRQAIEEYGLIRLLIDISDIQTEDIGAMDDDVREDMRLLYIEREAIIGDEDWEKRLMNVDHFFLFPNTDVRYFREEHRQEAWRWVREDLKQMPLPGEATLR